MSKRSNAELLEIITTLRDEYQPEAVVAAEAELKKRTLTYQQLTQAKAEFEAKEQQKEKTKKTQYKISFITNTLNSLKEDSTDTAIKLITIGLLIFYLFYFFNHWKLTVFMLQDLGEADLSVIEYFTSIILFPIGLFGFWQKKKYGWIILSVLLTYLSFAVLLSFGLAIEWALESDIHSSYSTLKELIAIKDSLLGIGEILLLIGLLVYINGHSITKEYKISKLTQLLAIGLTAVPLIFLGIKLLI
jgi:hypothetical protein